MNNVMKKWYYFFLFKGVVWLYQDMGLFVFWVLMLMTQQDYLKPFFKSTKNCYVREFFSKKDVEGGERDFKNIWERIESLCSIFLFEKN